MTEESTSKAQQANKYWIQDEQRYRLLIENIPSVVWVTARDGTTVFISDNVEQVYGYTADEILSGGSEIWYGRIHPDDKPWVQEAFEALFTEEKEFNVEYRIKRKDGSWIWQSDRAKMVTSVDGQMFAYGVFSDITERKQTEESYRHLIENSLQALVIVQDSRIVFANPAAGNLSGYTIQELMEFENAFQVLLHPDDLALILQREKQRSNGETVESSVVFRVIQKNGQARWMEAYTTLIDWRGKTATHTVFIDITERKQAEEELRRISEGENKRREELEKLRDISASMREAEGSNELLDVVTKEVQELFQADVVSSILFKSPKDLITFINPGADLKLKREQSDAIKKALLNAREGDLNIQIPGFETVLLVQLQSSEAVHGALMVASQSPDAFSADAQNLLTPIADMTGTALNRIDIWETLEERVRQRTHDLVVLYNLITIISENWKLQDLLELSLVLTIETVQADRGIVYLLDEGKEAGLKPVIQRGFADGYQIEVESLPDDDLAYKVLELQKALSLDDLNGEAISQKYKELNSYVGIPIKARGVIRGVFSLFANEEGAFGPEEMALLASIADHLGIGIENSILHEQSRESAALEERNRLARDLHDSVSQLLYSLTLMTGTTKKMLERGSDVEAVKNSVDRLGETAHRALQEMRLLLFELRPAVLDSEGLIGALRHRIRSVEEGLGVKVDLQAKDLPELPSDVEDALYHIALEALNNIVKHSESKAATIQFTVEKDYLSMEISDEGKGFDIDILQRGLGLRNMRERGQMLNSEVIVQSNPGEGTRVSVEVKLPSHSPTSS